MTFNPAFANLPISIFQHMTMLALKHDAVNLGQGFPDQDGPLALREVAAKQLLDRNPDPTEEDIRWAISGNLCRCTGYQNIVKSVLWAAAKLRGETPVSSEAATSEKGAGA